MSIKQLIHALASLHALHAWQADAERDNNETQSLILQGKRAYLMQSTNAILILWGMHA